MFFEIDLGPLNGVLSFRNLEEIGPWFEKEWQFYEWASKVKRINVQPDLWQHISHSLSPIRQTLSNAASPEYQNNEKRFRQTLDTLRSEILAAYVNNHFLLSSTPQAAFVEALKKLDVELASGALRYFLKLDLNLTASQHAEGVLKAILFEKGYESNIDSEKSALAELRSKAQLDINSYNDDIRRLQEQINETLKKIENNMGEQEKRFAEFQEKSKKRLEELEVLYKKKLSVEASVTYWGKKREHHNLLGWIWGGLSFAAIPSLGLILWWVVSQLLLSQEAAKALTDPKQLPYWRFGVLAIIAVLGFWTIRIFVRIFLSHLHLANDAYERVTMITTYLALLKEQGAIEERERQVILQTLFRPGSTGIVKDDLVPPGWLELLSRQR